MEIDKIINADSYIYIKNIPDKSIDCVYIDVPYEYTTGGTSDTKLGQRYFKRTLQLKNYDEALIKNSNKEIHNSIRIDKFNAKKRLELDDMDCGIDYSIFEDLCRVMKKVNIFIWCSKKQIPEILKYFVDHKHCNFDILVWAKTNAIPTNNCFLSNLEYCLYFRESGVKFNSEYENKSKWFCSSSNKADKNKFGHPTIKPLQFVEQHIKLATNPGDVVLDCFLGSGTTVIACKNTGRHYIGIERNKKHYKTAVERSNCMDRYGQTTMFPV